MEELALTERNYALYNKLHVSAGDIAVAQQCAEFIKKKKWHDYSFVRRGSVQIQQIAFSTR